MHPPQGTSVAEPSADELLRAIGAINGMMEGAGTEEDESDKGEEDEEDDDEDDDLLSATLDKLAEQMKMVAEGVVL